MVRYNPGVPYIHTQEFLNPKSMPTPAVAAALVSLISGALFKLSVDMALSLLVLSFFIGVIVFFSKEFCSMRRWARGFFYILNSLKCFEHDWYSFSVFGKDPATIERVANEPLRALQPSPDPCSQWGIRHRGA